MNPTLLGQRIRQAREQQGLSRLELSKAVGKDPRAIYEYELGSRKLAAIDIPDFASALNVPISFFFDGNISSDAIEDMLLYDFRQLPNFEMKQAILQIVKTLVKLTDPS